MTKTQTLIRHRPFTYEGSVDKGVTVNYPGQPHITAQFFAFMLHELKGKTMPTGFFTATPSDGFDSWLALNSAKMNSERLSTGNAPHVAAILVHEGYAIYRRGDLTFKP
jgi:hypothetical protein